MAGHKRTDLPPGQGRGADRRGRLVWVDEQGHVIGEDHWRAKLSNAQVDEIRDALEQPEGRRPSHRALARQYGVAKATITAIGAYVRRAATPVATKRR